MITGAAVVAGVVGSPVTHSLSPLIHNAWIEAAGLDAVYVPFAPPADGFTRFVAGLRGGAVRGLNVTVPFKEAALALATKASERAQRAGAANLLLFEAAGVIVADNTDGFGMLAALAEQAPGSRCCVRPGGHPRRGRRGAGRGRRLGRSRRAPSAHRQPHPRARRSFGPGGRQGERRWRSTPAVFEDACLIVNATTLGLGGGSGPAAVFRLAREGAVALDMVYRPLRTEFLQRAANAGLSTVDGLAMLIGQAAPSFEAFFGVRPPPIDVRALCLTALGETA